MNVVQYTQIIFSSKNIISYFYGYYFDFRDNNFFP